MSWQEQRAATVEQEVAASHADLARAEQTVLLNQTSHEPELCSYWVFSMNDMNISSRLLLA